MSYSQLTRTLATLIRKASSCCPFSAFLRRFPAYLSLLFFSLKFCSAWGERSINFAVYLFLVRIFPNTLLPASIYGFCVTGSGIFFSGSVGNLIDKYNRLLVVRCATVGQKFSMGTIYAVLLAFFLTPLGRGSPNLVGPPLAAFVGVVASGAILKVSTVCSTICIERDWASTIGGDSSQRLTKLNTWLRRIVSMTWSPSNQLPLIAASRIFSATSYRLCSSRAYLRESAIRLPHHFSFA